MRSVCPQVGGYLAFIGLFCLEAGLAIASSKDVQGINTWGKLLNQRCHATEVVLRYGYPYVLIGGAGCVLWQLHPRLLS